MDANPHDNIATADIPDSGELEALVERLYLSTSASTALALPVDLAGGSAALPAPTLAMAAVTQTLEAKDPAPTPMDPSALDARAPEVAVVVMRIDLIFMRICDFAGSLAMIRLARVCRGFRLVMQVEQVANYVYAGLPARNLGRRGFEAVLLVRWNRFGFVQQDVNDALIGAATSGKVALAKWLLSASVNVGGFEQPLRADETAVDVAIVKLVENGLQCDLLEWFLGEALVRPSTGAVTSAFTEACGRGKLGLAQVAWRHLSPRESPLCPHAQQILLVRAIEATQGMACHRHVVVWARSVLQYLEARYLY